MTILLIFLIVVLLAIIVKTANDIRDHFEN